jgi:hypothetical protein
MELHCHCRICNTILRRKNREVMTMNTVSAQAGARMGTELSNRTQVRLKDTENDVTNVFGEDSADISSGKPSSDDCMLVQSIGIGGTKIRFNPAQPLTPEQMEGILENMMKLQQLHQPDVRCR